MRMERFWAVAGAAVLVAGLAGHALAQSGRTQCGGRNSAGAVVPNASCRAGACVGNCLVQAAQFKMCQAGTQLCANKTLYFSCPGNSMDGAGCTGTVIGPCQLDVPSCP
jgi:hypothetical protein